jgi:hypothetical protein
MAQREIATEKVQCPIFERRSRISLRREGVYQPMAARQAWALTLEFLIS